MKIIFSVTLISIILFSCKSEVKKHGNHYKKYGDVGSLIKATALIEVGSDTTLIQDILGEPIDFGFDYRYLSDSIGENQCPVGAVFGLEEGKVTWKDVFEICE